MDGECVGHEHFVKRNRKDWKFSQAEGKPTKIIRVFEQEKNAPKSLLWSLVYIFLLWSNSLWQLRANTTFVAIAHTHTRTKNNVQFISELDVFRFLICLAYGLQ